MEVSSYGVGPGHGFGLLSSSYTKSGSSTAPPNYFDVYMPKGGVSFDITTEQNGGKKRPYISGDLEAAFPRYALEPPNKRPRYDPFEDFMGYTSAQANERPFRGAAGDPVREFGFSLSMLGRSTTSTIGFLTNPTVPGNETIFVKQPNYELPGEYDLVIMRNQLPFETQTFEVNQAEDLFIDTTKRVGYTIPGINHYLASLQLAPRGETVLTYGQPLATDTKGRADFRFFLRGQWTSPDDILRHFHLGGICNSETFVGGSNSVTRTEHGLDYQRRESSNVKLNLIKYGRAHVLNLWRPRLPAGTKLWLILKRVPRPGLYRVDTTRPMNEKDDLMNMSLATFNKADGTVTYSHSQRPWQFVPWASNRYCSTPTEEDLEYEDEFGEIRLGRPIYIGAINKEDYMSAEIPNNELSTNLALLRAQQPLDIFYLP